MILFNFGEIGECISDTEPTIQCYDLAEHDVSNEHKWKSRYVLNTTFVLLIKPLNIQPNDYLIYAKDFVVHIEKYN